MNVLNLIALGKLLACAAAIALLFFVRVASQYRLKGIARPVSIALLILALLAVPMYLDFGYYPKHGRFMNPHGWFHYYLGAKYSDEVGYENLYNAVVVANTENNGKLKHDRVREMKHYSWVRASDIMREAATYKALFSETRWQEFKKDVAYFQQITIDRRWPGVVHDKGYNATPTWNMVGAILTNLTDTAKPMQMRALLWLDPLLLALMLGLVSRVFGWRVMAFMLVYFGTHFAFTMYGVNEIRGAFLRWDWLALMGISICLLKRGWYKTAGGLMAYAGMARLFPLVFLFGLGAKFVWDIFKRRRLERKYVEFFAAFAVVGVAIVAASVVWDGGLQHWQDFFAKIAMHDEGLSSQRTGFKYAFIDTFEGSGGKQEWFEDHQLSWRACQLFALIVAFFAVRKLEDYESVAFSYVPMYFLSAPTTYYQIALLIPLFLFLPKLDNSPRLIGAALSFVLSMAFLAFDMTGFMDSQWALSGFLSWLLLLYCAYLIFAGFKAPALPVAGDEAAVPSVA